MSSIVSTQFQLPQAIISNGFITNNSWSSPDNLLLTDSDVASSDPSQTASDVIVGNFPFSLPLDAIITGVEVELIGVYAGSPSAPSPTLTVYFVDNTSGANQYYPYTTPVALSITPTDYVLGSSTYQFATSFSPTQINNAKIALVANSYILVDAVKLKVFYYIPTPVTPPTPIGNNCTDCNSPIQVQNLSLALPFYSGDRYMYLNSFNYPDGTPVNFSDLGSCGGVLNFVVDPELSKLDPASNGNFAENVVTNIWEVMSNGTIRFDFGVQTNVSTTRGLNFHTPYTADPNLRSNHNVGARVIISDNGPFLGQLLRLCQAGSIFSEPVSILYNSASIVAPATEFDFRGAGVSVVDAGSGRGVITIPGAGGTTPPQVVSTTFNSSLNIQVTSLSADLQISGLNRGVVIQVSTEQSKTITSVTVGGVGAVQQVVSTDVTANLRQETWFIANPPLGPQPVVITMSVAAYIAFGAECVSGLDPVTPVGNTQTATGNNNNPTLSLTTTVDYSLVIDGLATALTPILYTPGPGQTSNWMIVANGNTRQGGSSVENAGISPDPIAMTYIITQSTRWCYTAIELVGITSTVGSKVSVDGSDTTPGYLDDKIEIVNGVNTTVVKTILNVAGNEKIRYQINASGGGGGGGNYIVDQSPLGTGSSYGSITGAINSSNTLFTVSAANYASGSLVVILNGEELKQGIGADWTETSPAGGTFTFTVAPIPGDIITVIYQSANTISQTGIQFQDENGNSLGTAGTVQEFELTGGATGVRVGNKVTYTITGDQKGIQFEDEGSPLGTSGTVDELDFVGPGVSAGRAGNKVTVTIPGGGSVNVLNVSELDDFTNIIRTPIADSTSGTPQEYGISGNFIAFTGSTTRNFVWSTTKIFSELNHQGIFKMTGNDNVFGFQNSAAGNTGGNPNIKGLISIANDFQIEYLNRFNRAGGSFDCIIGLSAYPTSSFDVYIRISNVLSATKIVVWNGTGNTVSSVNIPTSNTWFKTIFSWVASTSTLTITVDGNTVYSGTPTFTETNIGIGMGNVTGTAGTYLDVDYVLTSYQVTR